MGVTNIANSISDGASTLSSVLRAVNSLVSKNMSSSEIRERYTNGFYNTSNTIFTPAVYSKMFDEPTYLTFRIQFDFSTFKEENLSSGYIINSGNKNAGVVGFDKMPEPLLSFGNNSNSAMSYYSTYDYLKNVLGETYRAKLLENFIKGLQDIQNNYPYYFTSVSGLNTLSKVNPSQGIRINADTILTISCLEGLDLKITSLMQMYRKIAWDDVYQRWILPDMMRYFGINIYVSEIRLFHSYAIPDISKSRPGVYNFDTNNFLKSSTLREAKQSLLSRAGNVLNSAVATSTRLLGYNNGLTNAITAMDSVVDAIASVNSSLKSNAYRLCDHAINDFMPTIKFECHMCEFDISDSMEHISTLSSSKSGTSASAPSIKIKVGNIKEKMVFPLQAGGLIAGGMNKTYKYSDDINVINDDDLQVEATWRSLSTYNTSEISSEAKKTFISGKYNRVNKNYGDITNVNEDYVPMEIPDHSALQSLIAGALNYVFDKTNLRNLSTATNNNDEVSNVYANTNINPNHRSIVQEHRSIYELKRSLDDLNTTIKSNSSNVYDSLSNKFPSSVTNKNIITASLALSNVVNNVYDGEIINSMDVDEKTRFAISENIFKEILNKISKSEATDNDVIALKVLANVISEEYHTDRLTSTATNKNKFSNLN